MAESDSLQLFYYGLGAGMVAILAIFGLVWMGMWLERRRGRSQSPSLIKKKRRRRDVEEGNGRTGRERSDDW